MFSAVADSIETSLRGFSFPLVHEFLHRWILLMFTSRSAFAVSRTSLLDFEWQSIL